MALKFGTSGVRGLVTDMTDLECFRYGLVYGQYLKTMSDTNSVVIAGDHRSSTNRIMLAVKEALASLGFEVINGGKIPTPAVAYFAMKRGFGSIMVTGSHIPEDRNGIKFYMPWGEILKPDEQVMTASIPSLNMESYKSLFDAQGAFVDPTTLPEVTSEPKEEFTSRYLDFFPSDALKGLKLVVYQHSTVLREIFPEVLEKLGAQVICVGWSDQFIPVDTEAVENPERLKAWVAEHRVDALVSADGDGDRPLLINGEGDVIRGDILGVMASKILKADGVATPISCNSALEKSQWFSRIERSKIGSPWVISAMEQLKQAGAKMIVGYEANGGYLTASDLVLEGCQGSLSALPTRDAILPILAVLSATKGSSVLDFQKTLPSRLTDSLLLRGISMESAQNLLKLLTASDEKSLRELKDSFGVIRSMDSTDGVRCYLESDEIIHFRPSGNAPEFRCYLEADTKEALEALGEKAKKYLLERVQ